MKTNTSTDQLHRRPDERKQLFNRIVFLFGWKGESRRSKANNMMNLIDQYVHQKTIEALQHVDTDDDGYTWYVNGNKEVRLDEYIAELQASLNTEGSKDE